MVLVLQLFFHVGDVLVDFEGFVAQREVLFQGLVRFQSLGIVAHDLIGHAFLDEEHWRGEVVGILAGSFAIEVGGILIVAQLHVAVADSAKSHRSQHIVVVVVFLQVFDGVVVVTLLQVAKTCIIGG